MASTPEQAIDEMIRLRRWIAEHRERCWHESDEVEPSEIMPDSRRFETVHVGPSDGALVTCRRCGQSTDYLS